MLGLSLMPSLDSVLDLIPWGEGISFLKEEKRYFAESILDCNIHSAIQQTYIYLYSF